jgi:hypothetical protein
LVAGRKRDDQLAISRQQWGPGNNQPTIRNARERYDSALDLARVAHVDRVQLDPKRRRQRLDDAILTGSGTHTWIAKDRCSGHPGRDLFEQFQPFAADFGLECAEPGNVPSRYGETLHVAGTDWVDDRDEYDRDGARCSMQCCQGRRPVMSA